MWRSLEEDEPDPQPVRAGLEKLAQRLGTASVSVNETVFGAWEELVGSPVAENTQPESLKNGVLTVVTAEPAWARQLEFLKSELLDRINGYLGVDEVSEIVVRVRRPGAPTPPR